MENFLVSARKYRPATFASVVGQQHITSTLKNAIARRQIAHAYLFCGPRGVGKTTCARILAKAINCLHPTAELEACGECESCRAFNENRSFNIHELDAASNNSVDDIRALTEQVRIPPQIGRYSVYIIDEAHMLSASAFNAFLKTLEEPPAHAVFILATTEKHKILPTILSRCQTYDFSRIKVDDVVKYLQYIAGREGVSYDDEALHIVAGKADGCMRDALSMYDKAVSFCGDRLEALPVSEALNVLDYDTYFAFTDAVLEGDYASALVQFDRVLQKGFDGQIFLGGLNKHFRDLLVARNKHTLPLLEVTGTVAQRYVAQAARCPASFLFDALALVTGADTVYKQAVNPRLHVELCLLKLSALGGGKNDLTAERTEKAYPLPAAGTGTGTPAGRAAATQAGPAPVKKEGGPVAEAKPIPQETGTTVRTEKPAAREPQPVPGGTATPAPGGQGAESPAAVPPPAPIPAPERTEQPPASTPSVSSAPSAPSGPLISGISIHNIIQHAAAPAAGAEQTENRAAVPEERAEKKVFTAGELEVLKKGCRAFARELQNQRPRVSLAFEDAEVLPSGLIMAKAGSEILKEEMLNGKHDLLKRLVEITGIPETDFDVEVEVPAESTRKLIVKPEDKFRHMVERNRDVLLLREELDLDLE